MKNYSLGYYSELKKLADKVIAPYDKLFELALNSPEVIQTKIKEVTMRRNGTM